MNTTTFSERLRLCRKHKFSSQQAFADAYMEQYGMIRETKKRSIDHNMFGTVQSWEQGKSIPTADVLANICDLLDCDADFLLGRIDERNHDINDMRRYTGLSAQAIEKLHEYAELLSREEWWLPDEDAQAVYLQGFALFLIDELLTGSTHHQLEASVLNLIYGDIYENRGETMGIDDFKQLNSWIYNIVQSITSILTENAEQCIFPPALAIRLKNNCYDFRLSSRKEIESGEWDDCTH